MAVTFIYICTVAGWAILAGTMLVRTDTQDKQLHSAVGQLWGTKHIQTQPRFSFISPRSRDNDDSELLQSAFLDASDITVDLNLEHRRKGLLWYSTYRVAFTAKYRVVNQTDQAQEMLIDFMFPAQHAVYDNFHFIVAGEETNDAAVSAVNTVRTVRMEPGESKEIEIAYQSQGLDEWHYRFGPNVNQVRNFSLVMNTDFDKVDFPESTISSTDKTKTKDGWQLTWQYENLLTGVNLGMVLPQKLNPGPWVGQVTAAAPVSLFLFFFLLFVCTTVRNIKIHPVNYFFIGAAFFSFHLLLAYLVDHVSIHAAFWICSAVSIFLVVSYMRLVVGAKFAFTEIALFQFVYLVLFSYTFFFVGYTGLAITVLCICTLFVVMQFTGKVDWEKAFAKEAEKKIES